MITKEEAIKVIKDDALYNPEVAAMVIELLIREDEREKSDGCLSCAYYDVEEWDMPCEKCRRNCRDYWRRKAED